MKTVTIPTCANPFVVIVNGIKYTYPAGATMEVPDDVAEVIEQHEEAKPEPAPVLPPFSPVPSSGESDKKLTILTNESAEPYKYLFNELNFPPLPQNPKGTYPYWFLCLIKQTGWSEEQYFLLNTDAPIVCCQGDNKGIRGSGFYFGYMLGSSGEWGRTNEGYINGSQIMFHGIIKPIWANYDTLTDDGSMCLEGSDPLSLYSAREAYVFKDGKYYAIDGKEYVDQQMRENPQKYWKSGLPNEAVDLSDIIILGGALQAPGGVVTLSGTQRVEEVLDALLPRLIEGVVTIKVGIDGTTYEVIRVVAQQITSSSATFSFLLDYNGNGLLVSIWFYGGVREIGYSAKIVTASPMVPA